MTFSFCIVVHIVLQSRPNSIRHNLQSPLPFDIDSWLQLTEDKADSQGQGDRSPDIYDRKQVLWHILNHNLELGRDTKNVLLAWFPVRHKNTFSQPMATIYTRHNRQNDKPNRNCDFHNSITCHRRFHTNKLYLCPHKGQFSYFVRNYTQHPLWRYTADMVRSDHDKRIHNDDFHTIIIYHKYFHIWAFWE